MCKNKNLVRLFTKDYLDQYFPVDNVTDKDNMNFQIEAKRIFKCSNCGLIKRLGNIEYIIYILKANFKRLFKNE